MGTKRVAGKPWVIKPAKYLFADAMKAIDGGDDSRVKAALFRMEVVEIDYLLQLTKRFEGLLKQHLKSHKGG